METSTTALPSTADSVAVVARDDRSVPDDRGAPVGGAPARHRSRDGSGSGSFRGDVEGLRAVAVGLVLLYHAGLPFVPGGFVGVDVFFVISGFLITTQLVAELGRTGRISLARFYARRAKRLLPAVGVVLAATVVLVWLSVPRIRWEEIGGDVVGSALYVVNWRLAGRSVDYLAEDSQPSPVQHFWSLAVEEQFYLVWPLLILLAALVARIAGRTARPILWLGLAVVGVPSFAWAVLETAHSPASAFFITTTRMWELSIGAAVALGAGLWARLGRRWAIVVGWVGLAGVAASGVLVSTATPWPGYAAALPTLGTAAVIAAGFAVVRGGPASLLGTGPMRWLGALSYSLYLWHWPLLVAATAYWDGLSVRRGLLVAALSLLPAWLTFRLVENPLRYSTAVSRSPRFALSLGANFTLVGVVAGLVLMLLVATSTPTPAGSARGEALGAAVLSEQPRDDPAGAPVDRVDWITPDPLKATEDIPDVYRDGCHQNQPDSTVLSCTYGHPDSDTTVAVVGDSKVAQWLPALQLLAEQNNWRLDVFTKSSCSFASATTPGTNGEPYALCTQWNALLLRQLVDVVKPDYVITSQGSSRAVVADGTLSVQTMVDGLRASWAALSAIGSDIIVIADNPHPGINVYACVDQHRQTLTACTYSRDRRTTVGAYSTQVLAVKGQKHVRMIDLYDAICPTARCAPVIGNVLIYRQGAHITATYVRTLTPRLAAAVSRAGLNARYHDGQ